MSQLSFIPLSLSIIFSLVGAIPAHSIEQEEERLPFEYSLFSKKPLETIKEEDEDQIHHHLQFPSTPVLYDFQPSFPKVDSAQKLQPYCGSPIFQKSHLGHLYDSNENIPEDNFNKTISISASYSPQPISRRQKFQNISLVTCVSAKKLSKLRKNYNPPFNLFINNSGWSAIPYTYKLQDVDLEFGKIITLAEDFSIDLEEVPISFIFIFTGYPKIKKMSDNKTYKPQIIDKGKIGGGLNKEALLKYSLSEGNSDSLPFSIFLNISLFDKEQTNVFLTMGQKIKQLI